MPTRSPLTIPSLASDLKAKTDSVIEGAYYKLTLKGGITARSFALRFGPARFRVHCARIGKGLYITNSWDSVNGA